MPASTIYQSAWRGLHVGDETAGRCIKILGAKQFGDDATVQLRCR